MMGMPDCEEVAHLVTEYLEGTMPLGQRVAFRVHVAMCKDCRAWVDQLRATRDALGRVPDTTPPDDLLPALAEAFRGWTSADGEDRGRDGG